MIFVFKRKKLSNFHILMILQIPQMSRLIYASLVPSTTVFPRIISALEQFSLLNTFMYCHQRSHYIRPNSKKNSFCGKNSQKYGILGRREHFANLGMSLYWGSDPRFSIISAIVSDTVLCLFRALKNRKKKESMIFVFKREKLLNFHILMILQIPQKSRLIYARLVSSTILGRREHLQIQACHYIGEVTYVFQL